MKRQKTRQETFDRVVKHMLTQRRRSKLPEAVSRWLGNGATCAYRGGEDGSLMCGVGCLIDDRNYITDIEGRGADHRHVRAAIRASGWSTRIPLVVIQDIHDSYAPSAWEAMLEAVAKENGLKFNPPQVKK